MVTKPTNAYNSIKVSCIINIARTVHVSAILGANLKVVHYKGYITKVFEPKTCDLCTSSKNFCNMSFVMHLPEVGHKICRNT